MAIARTVCLWATPRSVSTAFEKAVSRAPGVDILHEPFTYAYYFGPRRRSRRYGDAESSAAPADDPVVRLRRGGTPVLFIKELAFQGESFVDDDTLQGMWNCFIIRHPHLVMQSLLPLKPDFTEEEFGFGPIERVYERVLSLQGEALVIDGTIFRAFPRSVLRNFCRWADVPFDERMLSWDDGRIREWRDDESESQAKWHKTLEGSHGVLPPRENDCRFEVPAERKAMFDRALMIYERLVDNGSAILPPGEA